MNNVHVLYQGSDGGHRRYIRDLTEGTDVIPGIIRREQCYIRDLMKGTEVIPGISYRKFLPLNIIVAK